MDGPFDAAYRRAREFAENLLKGFGLMFSLKTPLTAKQLRARAVTDFRLQVVIAIDLNELMCIGQGGSMDGMNNYADEHILGDELSGYMLADLSYRAVGTTPDNEVLIEVNADVEEILAGLDDANEEEGE